MSVQVFLYHDRLQKDVNSLTDLVQELREWKAAKEERRKSLDERNLTRQWAVGLSITTAVALLGAIVALFVGR
ncbi:hypothetical protein SEF58_13150 [Neomoorella humiferrea]|uniref:hypothetical protein n=1 Tax=Neomoorella humiferrea TaxID=676965 RepID=UPI003D8B245A